ncbi:Hsp20/alpha crystallin family protein [Crassaminicella indica]|uniref:Hsp20/alpha crystallin family protein n=1 Tax=Crassaminicella indica TaxID=2855394 RepID=A0ABX8R7X8_9CLOT|nr:Hsp20/alpha crystallin family protein [Crassaminicella indica]QXM05133.1 Hsp20/alpha crystallin family protein [Crassaminicella indica]
MFGMIPFNRRNQLQRRSNDLFGVGSFFDEFFNDSWFMPMSMQNSQMKVDIKENEKEYFLEAELPGVNKEDINIDLRDDYLTISVKSNEVIHEERENYIRKERRYGSMSRSFYVDNIEHEGVEAKFENGILTIKLPKKEIKEVKSRRIDIQ